MAILLKCKMCGGDISVSADMTIGTCQYCGSTMTLPHIDTDKKARLFNHANQYRLNNEFDKAYDAYKAISEEDEQEAEAYWGMILSEYGIEYVEDPYSKKRIATCHRTHVQNIQDSSNYKLALKYADVERRFLYKDEAEALDKLQRNILAVSSKEGAYDVFICYKESDEDGQRTQDSVLAQDIYNELEKAGVRAFFARISLENHIGENYEPYIFGALSSARVMLIVATNGENLDSVWVKNEWKRYLSFMESDETKVIIPVYKGMTAYDFPSELSKFQAQDMGKVGAIQDLIHGIKKILGTTKTKERDSKLDSLIEEKQERDDRSKKTKRIVKTTLIAVSLLAIIITGFFVGESIKRNAYARDIENRSITVEKGVPDCEEYYMFTISITKDNYFDYFEIDSYENNKGDQLYMSLSKLVDTGWILWSVQNGYFIFSDGYQDVYPVGRSSETLFGVKTTMGIDDAGIGIMDTPVDVTFVSHRVVDKVNKETLIGNRSSREVILKDGQNSIQYFSGIEANRFDY